MVQTSLSAWLTRPKSQQNATLPDDNASKTAEDDAKSDAPARSPAEVILNVAREKQKAASSETPEILAKSPAVITKTQLSKQCSLPSNAILAAITAETLPAFRRMVALLLPVAYPDAFYNEILTDNVASNISLVCLWSDTDATTPPRVVSGIRCRLLAASPAATYQNSTGNSSNHAPSLYISTVTTLAPYRGHGIASELLKRVIARAIRDYGVATVTAHMWEANEDAREWYAKHGFREVRFEERYYRNLRPGGAWVLERNVGPEDLLHDESGFNDQNGRLT
ncbi:hypothetical protein EJ08DRAFT_83655 [Tothia fuscella]|uniref:N-acetyltransferase domain-containing protein n=1 Tax=Tothia fuscella TaxID=1048955 RepID=A0A9P4NEE2_9PEZI|nr:hypothetical protein EJ08DRAFT_83655 [Tothia fuscella]